MTYGMMGATEWRNVSGTCRPMDTPSLNLFKELQSQLNRVAKTRGYALVNVDGRIGPKTIALYNQVMNDKMSSCETLAAATAPSGVAVQAIKRVGDSMGAPARVPAPITSRPSIPDPAGGVPKDPPALAITDTIFNMVSSPMGLLLAGGLAFGAYKLATGKKGGKGKAKKTKIKGRGRKAKRPNRRRVAARRRTRRGRRR